MSKADNSLMIMENSKARSDEYEELLLRRDQLFRESGSYMTAYTQEFGDLITANFELKVECIKKKKTISYCRRRLNRGLSINADRMNAEIEAKLIELDLNKKRVILSSKQLTENPWETLGLKAGDVIDCKVVKVTEDGVKFLSNGVTGFLPKVNFGEKTEFAAGEEFQAKVRIFDAEKNKLSVSMREPRPKTERENRKPSNEVNKMLKNQEKINSTLADFINLDDYK